MRPCGRALLAHTLKLEHHSQAAHHLWYDGTLFCSGAAMSNIAPACLKLESAVAFAAAASPAAAAADRCASASSARSSAISFVCAARSAACAWGSAAVAKQFTFATLCLGWEQWIADSTLEPHHVSQLDCEQVDQNTLKPEMRTCQPSTAPDRAEGVTVPQHARLGSHHERQC